MTYEEYKNSKDVKNKKNYFKIFIDKLFTVVIFTMCIIIISNYSPKFKAFITDNVLNTTLDFSKFNKLINKTTSVFKVNDTKDVLNIYESKKTEKYLDGIKYIVSENEIVQAKDGGIVTFIGNKDGYNNTVIIQQSNGYYAWYGNIEESIKLYDYVERGSQIGKASHEYYYVLLKDDKVVDLNEG